MRSTIETRKSRNIYIPKYFMAVKNCINIIIFTSTSLSTWSYIGELRNGRKFKCENKPFIVFISILKIFLFQICFFLFEFELIVVGMTST